MQETSTSSNGDGADTFDSSDGSWIEDPIQRAKWLEEVLCTAFDMDEDDARMICGVVVEQFGQKSEVLDDKLPSDVRSIFYTLEAKRILTFRRIEYENEDGATFRGFFWRLNADRIERHLAEAEREGEQDVYEELPASCWQRSAA